MDIKSEDYNFPFSKVIESGIKQQSSYWATLALEWLSQHASSKKEKCIIELLEKSIQEKWASQKLRQKIQDFLEISKQDND